MLKGAVKETAPLESLHTKKTGRQDHKAGYRTSSSGKPAGTTSGVNMRDALDVGEIRTLVVSAQMWKKGHFQSHCFSKIILDLTEGAEVL